VAVLIVTVLPATADAVRAELLEPRLFNAVGRRTRTGLWTEALRFVPLAAAVSRLTVFSVWARMTMRAAGASG